MNLMVDIGNSRLKWGIGVAGQFVSGASLFNHQVCRRALIDMWADIVTPMQVGISCVSSKRLSAQVCDAVHELWPNAQIVEIIAEAYAYGVTNAYLHPEKLGVDRWLALIAVHARLHSPACIVDCGTAITIDLIEANGVHQGGMICPGLTLMKKSLSEGADALTFNDTKYGGGAANFTEGAIYSGTLGAAAGLIERVYTKQPENSVLILTGGDAQLIAAEINCKSTVDEYLVLRGLAIVLEG